MHRRKAGDVALAALFHTPDLPFTIPTGPPGYAESRLLAQNRPLSSRTLSPRPGRNRCIEAPFPA
jgi:hypothetical protein